jgi:amino acid permease
MKKKPKTISNTIRSLITIAAVVFLALIIFVIFRICQNSKRIQPANKNDLEKEKKHVDKFVRKIQRINTSHKRLGKFPSLQPPRPLITPCKRPTTSISVMSFN